MKMAEAPLVKIAATFDDGAEPVHAVLTAVGNRVFCISFSRPLTARDDATRAALVKSVHSWRSDVSVLGPQ